MSSTSLRISYAHWSGAEYRALLGALLPGARQPERLAVDMRALLGGTTSVYPVNYAHTALEMALSAFQRHAPARSKVLVPAYVCPIVVHSIQACGLQPVPLPIGADLNLLPTALAAAIDGDTLAVVAPHMFGSPARIGEIEALCRDAGVFLVDDAAQVTGVQQDGRALGSFGDVGLLSFAQSKTIVCGIRGAGGLLLVNNAALDPELAQAWRQLPAASGRLGAIAEFLWNYQWAAVTRDSGERLLDRLERGGWRRPHSGPLQQAHIGRVEAGVARAQLRRLPLILAEKRRVADLYQQVFSGSAIGLPQHAPGRALARVMLTLPAGTDLAACRRQLSRHGIQTRLGYQVPFAVGPDTADAHAIAARLLGVPCGPGMTPHQVRHVRHQLELAVAGAALSPDHRAS